MFILTIRETIMKDFEKEDIPITAIENQAKKSTDEKNTMTISL